MFLPILEKYTSAAWHQPRLYGMCPFIETAEEAHLTIKALVESRCPSLLLYMLTPLVVQITSLLL